MIRKLPYADWMDAQRELRALVRRAGMLNLPHINSLLERVFRTLARDATPSLAGLELEYIAAQLRAYPEIRESLMQLSRELLEYPHAQTTPDLPRQL